MTAPFMRAYALLLIRTCHRRNAFAMGGMAAQIPIKDDPVANAAALEKVRADKVRVPIIVLSAKRALEDRVLCLQKGADDYVSKPFAFSEILARTHAVLRRSRGAAEPSRLEVADIVLDTGKQSVQSLCRDLLERLEAPCKLSA